MRACSIIVHEQDRTGSSADLLRLDVRGDHAGPLRLLNVVEGKVKSLNLEIESAANPNFTLDPCAASQYLSDLVDDGKAKTRTLITAGRGYIDLIKEVEDLIDLTPGYSDPLVGDGKEQTPVAGCSLDPDPAPHG